MRSIAGTFTFMWLIAAALMPARDSEASQPEKSQGGTMQITQPNILGRRLSPEDVRRVAPALETYTQERLYGDVWKRPDLAPRDRSLITIAALIARDQAPALTYDLNQAIENGVKPREISETITHLAFYAGWANAFAAVDVAKDVFAQRGIGADQLPPASVQLLPLDEAAEAERAKGVSEQFGTVAPGVVLHHRRAVPGSLAASRPGASGPKPRHRQRPDCHGTGRAAALSLEPGDGLRTNAAAGRRGPDAFGFLHGMAQCVLGPAGGKGRVREARPLKGILARSLHMDGDTVASPAEAW